MEIKEASPILAYGKLTRFDDIPKFTRSGNYEVNVGLRYIEENLESYRNDEGLELDPDFQRGHIWTREQQIRWVEFMLRGGKSNLTIYFNAPGWNHRSEGVGPMQIVDGKQRLEAGRAFIRGDIPAFGSYMHEWDVIPFVQVNYRFQINDLCTRAEVLQWYLDLNTGGTPHTSDEIERVKEMLANEAPRVEGVK